MFLKNDNQRQLFIENYHEWEPAKTSILNATAFCYRFKDGSTLTANDYRECDFLPKDDRRIIYILSHPNSVTIPKEVTAREMINFLRNEQLNTFGEQLCLF